MYPNAGKIVGVWRALSKMDLKGENSIKDDISPMKRAGAARVIEKIEDTDNFIKRIRNLLQRCY